MMIFFLKVMVNLTGLWFEGSKVENKHSNKETIYTDLPIFKETSRWLDIYFSGEEPDFTPKYKLAVLTPFRKQVIDIMLKIPYGKTTIYGNIAKEIAKNNNISKMSSRAVVEDIYNFSLLNDLIYKISITDDIILHLHKK